MARSTEVYVTPVRLLPISRFARRTHGASVATTRIERVLPSATTWTAVVSATMARRFSLYAFTYRCWFSSSSSMRVCVMSIVKVSVWGLTSW